MILKSPIIDTRDAEGVLESIDARAPGYTPEWLRQAGSPDSAVAQVFARYTEIFLNGFRQMPDRGFLAFLDTLGTRLLPAEAARAPLVFELMENATSDPLLVANSQIAATPQPAPPSPLLEAEAPSAPSEAAVFAVEKAITLARARLAAHYNIYPGSDEYADHSTKLTSGFTLFDELQPTPHVLYLGHNALFALAANAEVVAEVRLSVQLAPHGAAANQLDIDWEYLSADGWLPLTIEENGDGTDGFTHDGQITLRKKCGPDAKEEAIAGHTSYWIRGLLRTPLPPTEFQESGTAPVVDNMRASVNFLKADLIADAAATDAFALDISTNFFPFGRQPVRYTTFYLASKEVFQKAGARVSIHATLSEPGTPTAGTTIVWEYFDGKQWVSLKDFGFRDGTENFTKNGDITFLCPPDWAQTLVAGTSNYWCRARIDTGDYGRPLELTVTTGASPADTKVTAQPSTLMAPVVAALSLQYSYQTDTRPLDYCVAFNDFVFVDNTHACLWPREVFEPFRAVEERQPAVHFGFDRPLPSGLVSLFMQIEHEENDQSADPDVPAFVWEYRTVDGWKELGVLDETLGFQRTGMIQFIGQKDAVATDGLGGLLHRIRARLKIGEALAPLPVQGVWMNAVWATHRFFVRREELGVSEGNPRQAFHFRSRTPSAENATPTGISNASERPVFFTQGTTVLEGEMLEVREWAGRGADYETAIQDVPPEDIRYERDRITHDVTEVWVRWHERPHLFASRSTDRHYVIERAIGSVRFGDNTHGQIPGAGNRIVVSYNTGGGLTGNLPAGSISELRSAVPFLKTVTNPVPATGGAPAETIEAVPPRGAHQLRHGGRAVSALDIEWMARDASPAVARARCLAVTGPIGRGQPGWTSVVILPHSSDRQPVPTPELRRRVMEYLATNIPAASHVRILDPQYVAVSVTTTVVPVAPDEAARVEARLLLRLDNFLHPLTGGIGGRGWAFGESLHLSHIAALIEGTDGVDYASDISLSVGAKLFGDVVSVGVDALIASGDHELKLTQGEP